MRGTRHSFAGRLGAVLFLIAWCNFALFIATSVYLGGDALSGKVENGHHYLSRLNHRETKYVETSPSLWKLSRIQGISALVTHAIGIFVGGGLMTYANRRGRGPDSKPATAEKCRP